MLFTGREQPGMETAVKSILGGAISGGLTVAFIYPTTVMRVRMAMDVGTKSNREFAGMWDCLRHCGRLRFRDLYRGFWVSMLSSVVYRGFYFGLYEWGKAAFITDPHSANIYAAYGGIAFLTTTLSGILAYPFDTIKGRLIMQAGKEDP